LRENEDWKNNTCISDIFQHEVSLLDCIQLFILMSPYKQIEKAFEVKIRTA